MSSDMQNHTPNAVLLHYDELDGNCSSDSGTWGFLLARTTSSPNWDVALARIIEYLRVCLAADSITMSGLRFVVLDAPKLQEINDQRIREYCHERRATFNKALPYGIRTNVCLSLEESFIKSITNAQAIDFSLNYPPNQAEELAVYFRAIATDYVEIEDDDSWAEHGPYYRGWCRTTAMHLATFWQDLGFRDLDVVAGAIKIHGQIPVYVGQIAHSKLIDPPGGTTGRLRVLGRDVPDTIWYDVWRYEREERERERERARRATTTLS